MNQIKASYEKDNLGWQFHQFQQKLGEWWEMQVSQFVPDKPNTPDFSWLSWLNSPIIGTIAKIIFWLIVAFLLIWTALQLLERAEIYVNFLRKQQSQLANRLKTASVKELSPAAWRARSQKLSQEGNYREACLCLYMGMLQQLHDRGIILHQLSRTDGEYGELVQDLPHPIPYQILLMTHQQLCFSNSEASSFLFQQCQEAYREIEEIKDENYSEGLGAIGSGRKL
ncbi:MAG TPA: hypothetical protein DEG17_14265 [Cyanobacteria bacterium UBA11149]|nr:hypothetical protein [Cyanobacteria bacterium UBA11367]HBE56943.1 hypothetical protein [Cyanobacteria bacterium UBA11366]HBK62824.1 hypothetical protein [Cyanobacteria bacterium UBA11166]HBR73395.1 hypothetical protein [Cyanobacteria bacterium UBA11159]HBS67637.1 hypothetical protein [Cyanobacteria bacterium UBA11153]HBW90003.1 hypothetical protein [Cyanobacteria bacterium UBA11149]HCA96448.1 hypothetical protein [Cyanobacteria bacterium UBA9226]